ncbi:MAG: LTA synthase family protein, partial [Bacteroidota bacterium]
RLSTEGSLFVLNEFYIFAFMHDYFYRLKILLKRLLILFFLYSLCRLIFFLFNYSYFSSGTFSEIVKSFFFGIRFDAAAIVITNCLFIFLSVLPINTWNKSGYQLVLKTIFIIVNVVCLLFQCVDFGYFRFIAKRTTAELFRILALGNDTQNTVPRIVLDFWYVLLIFIFIIFLMVRWYSKISIRQSTVTKKLSVQLSCWLLVIFITASGILISRGGIQLKPLSIISAAKYSTAQNAQLVLNTPFTIIKTLGKIELDDVKYMDDDSCKKYFSLYHQYKKTQPFKNLNVVVIILESFSKEYIGGLNNYEGYTPFLDSLMKEGFVFTNAFANAKKSIEGIPAVVASIPALMNEPYITSAYNANKINSLASLLKEKGYESGFFHGGNNGTMGFDNFAKAAGFDFYKGRNEYGPNDYDGNWGVYDETFYNYFVSEMNKMKSPFMTCMFSISSHHPYSIPDKYKGKFKKGTLPIHESIRYADYSLKTFFENASHQTWFDNTLFVLTADHTGPAEFAKYQTKKGIYEIPILFYRHNSNLKGRSDLVTQQSDILPSVLDLLNFDKPFSAYGNSVFDSTVTHWAANFMSDSYQLIADENMIQFDGEKNIGLYSYKTDTLLRKNMLSENRVEAEKNSLLLKSIIQQFNHAMIHNEIVKK